ncbi:MT-A70 family protein [Agrobacterium deltaense Zutra 3/1]|uniref:MT-A70 family protein n=1 Tax=Agrobacterium deltaense Zutra 3/1 TaxID=1183427 RepID=A0A1S7QQP6_9HYPH|nr:MT-A70 family methyltransferase [Agrobacterium deltaense]CUX40646.1 MT-A70 family protein [Agrobacterium deltaense Zutra 3/1]
MTLIGERRQLILGEACRKGYFDVGSEGDRKSAVSLHMAGFLARDPKVSGRFYPTSAARGEVGAEPTSDNPNIDEAWVIAVQRDPASIDAGNRLRNLDEGIVAALMQSLTEYGQQSPVIVYGGESDATVKLGAGSHRLEACRRLGIKVLCFHKTGDDLDRQLCEIDENLIRADLTPADRALFLARRKEIYLVKHPETAHGAVGRGGYEKSGQVVRSFSEETAVSTGQHQRTIRRDVERGEKISATALRLLRGTRHDKGVTLDQIKRLETPEAQEQYARELIAADKAIAAESKEIRTALQADRRESRFRLVELIAKNGRRSSTEMPRRAFPIGYIDAPWQQEAWSEETGQDKGLKYPSMPLEEIMALCAGDKSPFTPDAVLFFWVPMNRLDDGIAVMQAWGFEFVSGIVWDKIDIGMGRWVRDRAEILLIGKRGKISLAPEMGTQPPSLYAEKKGPHSRKPVWFAEQIDRLYPTMPKLEMFQRRESLADGDVRLNGTWEFWGNQAGAPEGGAE